MNKSFAFFLLVGLSLWVGIAFAKEEEEAAPAGGDIQIISDMNMSPEDFEDKVAAHNISSTYAHHKACLQCGRPCTRYCCRRPSAHPRCCTDGRFCYCCR